MNTAEDPPQLENCVVNERFRLLRRQGDSGSSSVYLAEFEDDLPRKAALKLVAASEPEAEARLAGWNTAARLIHPNLVSVIDCGRCQIDRGQFVYEVTEYADEVLAEILRERPLTPDETREMLGPVLDTLTYMHAHGLAHGRIKPSNILAVNDQLKLSAESIPLGGTHIVDLVGASVYEAPELDHGPITPAVDVWALGMTLVAALTQKPAAWESGSGQEPLVPSEIVQPFEQIAMRCLRVNPAERCTLDEIRAILDPAIEHPAVKPIADEARPAIMAAVSSADTISRLEEPMKRRSSLKPALIALIVVGLVAWAALTVRKSMFLPPGTQSATQQSAPTPSPAVPSTVSPSATTPAPPQSIQKPSPSGRGTQATPQTKAATVSTPVTRNAESGGVLLRVNPEVLPAAQESIRGEVNISVRVTVDTRGNVTSAELSTPSRSKYFNRIAVDAARQWKFATGSGSTWQVQFQFRHDGTDLRATRE